MSATHWTLLPSSVFPGSDDWRVARTTDEGAVVIELAPRTDGPDGAAAVADAVMGPLAKVVELLRDHGYADEGVLLALPSHLCLAVGVATADQPSTRDQQALAFAFEQHLPLAAEELVAAIVETEAGALGLAIAIEPVREWVTALESAGVVVQSVSAAGLLALEELEKRGGEGATARILANPATARILANPATDGVANPATRVVLWQHDAQLECFLLAQGKPYAWRHFQAEPSALRQQLGFLALTRPPTVGSEMNSAGPLHVTTCKLAPELLEMISELPDVVVDSTREETLDVLAAEAAARVLAGTMTPWVEFRTGPLANIDPYRPVARPLRFATVAVIVCLAVVAATMVFRAHRYRSLAAEYHERQADIFRSALPGQSVPAGIVSRLESEHGKLTASNSAPLPTASKSALVLLHRVLAGLPQDIRYRIFEIHLEEGRIDLDGEVLSHSDADRIASALRSQELQVEPPRSQQLPNQAVGVRVSASVAKLASSKVSHSR